LILWENEEKKLSAASTVSVIRTETGQKSEDLLLLGDSSSEGSSTTSDLYLSSDSVSSSGGSNCGGGDEASIITIIRTISPSCTEEVSSEDQNQNQTQKGEMTSSGRTMSEEQMRNQFIRQETKHYFDDEDDGGFESFQVVDNDFDEDDGVGVEDGPFTPPSSSGSPDDLIIPQQRTFAQSQQNIPQKELAQKASSVLDLINAEISDLHMRELELKKKNRTADGKEIIEDDIMGEAERSSQADSDDYTDSAVDIAESFSRTSNSSGNVTPNDVNRMGRDGSPQSDQGQGDDEAFTMMEDSNNNSNKGTTSSLLLAVSSEEETNKTHQQQQQGIKVRPIVEEEAKSIALS
jgi:hypothetical protein